MNPLSVCLPCPGSRISASIFRLLNLSLLLPALLLLFFDPSMQAVFAERTKHEEHPYRLHLEPRSEHAMVGQDVLVDILVSEASPGLEMRLIRFRIEVDPPLLDVPQEGDFGQPGDFVPLAILSEPSVTRGGILSASYSLGSLSGSSSSSEGLLATLVFQAVESGSGELSITVHEAEDSDGKMIGMPLTEPAEIEIEGATGISPTPTSTPTATLEPTATFTPTPTPSSTATPTPTAPFKISLDMPDKPVERGQIIQVPVVVHDASPGLGLQAIYLDILFEGAPEDTFLIRHEESFAGDFIPGATLEVTDMAPPPPGAVSGRFAVSSATPAGSTATSGVLMKIGLLAHRIGFCRGLILSATNVLGAGGMPLSLPELPASGVSGWVGGVYTGLPLKEETYGVDQKLKGQRLHPAFQIELLPERFTVQEKENPLILQIKAAEPEE
jgi:hypothetical protein